MQSENYILKHVVLTAQFTTTRYYPLKRMLPFGELNSPNNHNECSDIITVEVERETRIQFSLEMCETFARKASSTFPLESCS